MASDLHPAWRTYRTWRILLWAGFLGYMPFVWVVATALGGSEAVGAGAAMTWMAAWAVCIIRVGFFRCPGCGHRFHVVASFPWWSNPWSRRCVNCGLKRWAAPERS
jgi:hypothetical protein